MRCVRPLHVKLDQYLWQLAFQAKLANIWKERDTVVLDVETEQTRLCGKRIVSRRRESFR